MSERSVSKRNGKARESERKKALTFNSPIWIEGRIFGWEIVVCFECGGWNHQQKHTCTKTPTHCIYLFNVSNLQRDKQNSKSAVERERERERGFWLSAKTKNSQISFFNIIYCTQNLILFFSLGRQSSACALMGSLWTSQFVWSTCMQPINNSNCLLISS